MISPVQNFPVSLHTLPCRITTRGRSVLYHKIYYKGSILNMLYSLTRQTFFSVVEFSAKLVEKILRSWQQWAVLSSKQEFFERKRK